MSGSILDYQMGGPSSDVDDFPGEDTNLSPEAKACKPGVPAEHPLGVEYLAPWRQPGDGFAEHSRRCARALAMAGAPVHLKGTSASFDAPDEEIELQVRDLLQASIARYSVRVVQIVPTSSALRGFLTHSRMPSQLTAARNAATALYTVWERDGIGDASKTLMPLAGQLWVANNANGAMLARAGLDVSGMRVIPVPYLPADAHLALHGRPARSGPVRFYHIGKWEDRKAQDKIIGAFMMAFRPGQAELLIKTSAGSPDFGPTFPNTPFDAAALWMKDARVSANGWTTDNLSPSIRMIRAQLSSEKLLALHEMCDVYVTLSRGEGFDMPAFDAKLSGNRMIYTPSGGPQDFASEDDILVPYTGNVPANPWYQWGPEATWGDFEVRVASEAFARAASDGKRVHDRRVDLSRFAAQAVGERMLEGLQELAIKLGGKVF